jgi:glycerol-3-phosphate dehydrogenase (NAD(P)+)
MTQVIAEEMPDHPKSRLACLSGPNFAVEVARGEPSATVVGTADSETGRVLQDLLMTASFRVYTNPDIAGVELGGSLKNIIALAVGICEGMGLGYNARAAVITRGITEITRLGLALGCQPLTFAGLSGMGDLVLTCTGEYSRNRQCGLAIGSGEKLQQFLERTGYTVEGIRTTQAAREIASALKMELPITEQVYEILFNGKSPRDGVRSLMTRDRKHEIEEVVRYR